jgi:hypothetical protein
MCNIFVEKDGFFRPAGGDISFQGNDRVTPVILQDVRGARSNGPFAPDNGVVRLRQRGTFLSFSGTFGSPSQMFLKKKRYLPPCRRRIGAFIQMNT